MTTNDLIMGTFTGTIISIITAKDGQQIGFIQPTEPSLCGAITSWKMQSCAKKRCDGNVQFVLPKEGQNPEYSSGNEFGLKQNTFVTFKIRFDGALPQAYEVKRHCLELGDEPMPAPIELKQLKAKDVKKIAGHLENARVAYTENDLLLEKQIHSSDGYDPYAEVEEEETEECGEEETEEYEEYDEGKDSRRGKGKSERRGKGKPQKQNRKFRYGEEEDE